MRFLTDEETARLKQFRLLHDYLEEKQLEVDQANKNLGGLEPANRRG